MINICVQNMIELSVYLFTHTTQLLIDLFLNKKD